MGIDAKQLKENDSGTRSIGVRLPCEDHRALRMIAAAEDTNVSEVIRAIIRKELARAGVGE
jgi:predicted DNA binding CopG/RHH family protein